MDEVVAAVRALLDRTTLRGAPVAGGQRRSGQGLAELRAALVGLRDRIAARAGAEPRRARALRDRSRLLDPRTRHRRDGHAARGWAGPRRRPACRAGRARTTIRIRELQVHGRHGRTGGAGARGDQRRRSAAVARLERGVVLDDGPVHDRDGPDPRRPPRLRRLRPEARPAARARGSGPGGRPCRDRARPGRRRAERPRPRGAPRRIRRRHPPARRPDRAGPRRPTRPAAAVSGGGPRRRPRAGHPSAARRRAPPDDAGAARPPSRWRHPAPKPGRLRAWRSTAR